MAFNDVIEINRKFIFPSIKPYCKDNKWIFTINGDFTSSLIVICVVFNLRIDKLLNIINQYNAHCSENDDYTFGEYYFDTEEDAQNALDTLLILKKFEGD